MTAVFFDGFRRVFTAPSVLAGVYVVTLLSAVPLTLTLYAAIASHLGTSVEAEVMVSGVNWAWWEEFMAQSSGFETTFTPSVIGFAAVMSNLSHFIDNTALQSAVVGVIVVYLSVWAFLIGGVLDRFARQRRIASGGFFAACGTYFFRFCRLAVLAGLAYWFLFGVVHEWLLDDLYRMTTRNFTVERTAFFVRLSFYIVFGLLLLPLNIVFDYAKIRAVVEDRRSMIGAVMAAFRFVRRRPAATVGLYMLNVALFWLVLVAYAIVAPGAGGGGLSMWTAFVIGQAYVIARLFTKLVFYATQTAYFQNQLAHAHYVAAPTFVWPESPVAEALGDRTL